MEKFNYLDAVKRLEEIASKVEDPSIGLEDIDQYIKESDELIGKCRSYLRGVRTNLDSIE